MNSNSPAIAYEILLYYKFTHVADPEGLRDEHEEVCRSLDLKGRILVAHEGINGTVSGTVKATEAYRQYMWQHPLFQGIEFKTDRHIGHVFRKLNVRVKPELVHLGLPQTWHPAELKAPYIEPEEMQQLLNNPDEDVVILDARSRYEYEIGKFRGAVTLPIGHFRELPEHLDKLAPYKDKKIVTYCTGGIKCEKLTGWLIQQGFEKVYQLHGGIIRYAQEAHGQGFEGKCYVFDGRLAVDVNTVDPVVVGHCSHCGQPTERIINCANADCNAHLLLCNDCCEKLEGCCSEPCYHSPNRRVYDGTGVYLRGVNSKHVVGQESPYRY